MPIFFILLKKDWRQQESEQEGDGEKEIGRNGTNDVAAGA